MWGLTNDGRLQLQVALVRGDDGATPGNLKAGTGKGDSVLGRASFCKAQRKGSEPGSMCVVVTCSCECQAVPNPTH